VLSLKEESEKDLKLLLRLVHDGANWKKIAGKRSKYDVYAHKIKAASLQNSISTFLEKLCHSLGIQSVKVEVAVLRRLEADREAILRALRRETIFYMLLATEEVND
jgi:hypothetical protein